MASKEMLHGHSHMSMQALGTSFAALGNRRVGQVKRNTRAVAFGVVVVLAAMIVSALYAYNNPNPFQPYHDSYEYVFSARRILAGGPWVNADRMPGYPLLLACIFALRGRVDLHAAEIAQYALFVVSALEVYLVAYRIWRRPALACLIGLLFGTNLYLLEYVKPLLSDALAMWLCITLCLAVVVYIERPRPLRVWAVAAILLGLTMTRAEWYLAPLGIFPFLWLIAVRAKRGKRIAPHAILALLAVLAVVVLYMRANASISGYYGLSEAENINLWAKVVQYHMTAQAPAQYSGLAAITAQGAHRYGTDVWQMYWHNPVLGADHFAQVGKYARAIILRHPVEFLWKSLPLLFGSLPTHHQWSGIVANRTTSAWLNALLTYSAVIFPCFLLFPLLALWHLGVWAWNWIRTAVVARDGQRSRSELQAAMTAALAMLALYDLALTTLGSYGEYERLHLAFDPLMLILIVGAIAYSVAWLIRRIGQVTTALSLHDGQMPTASASTTAVASGPGAAPSKWAPARADDGAGAEAEDSAPSELEEASAI